MININYVTCATEFPNRIAVFSVGTDLQSFRQITYELNIILKFEL